MKKGDRVVISDGSWTMSIIGGKVVHEFLNHGGVQGKHYVVVETDCSFPLQDFHQPEQWRNDTVIQDDGGKVVFIHGGFLRAATHTITIDGKTIELSHESFLNLKEQLV